MLADIFNDIPTVKVPIKNIIFDFENPRIQFYIDSQAAKGEDINKLPQSKIKYAQEVKTKKSYQRLYESIEANGLIDPIWISKVSDNKYVVVEGNTRKLVFDDLSENFPDEIKWKSISVRVLPESRLEDVTTFIRLESHLGGKLPWDAYERARYLYKLNSGSDGRYSIKQIAKIARKTEGDINKDIKAYKLMDEQFIPKYGKKLANPTSKYSYFVELLNNSSARKLVETGQMSIDDFCSWVASDRIPMAINVRNLSAIFGEETALKDFKEIGYEVAMAKLATIRPDIDDKLFSDIKQLISRLKNLKSYQMAEIKEEQVKQDIVRELIEEATKIVRV